LNGEEGITTNIAFECVGFSKYHNGDLIKEDDMDDSCGPYGHEKYIKI
jgi:hypothetical protein